MVNPINMNNQVTTADVLAQKIEEKRYSYFTFPILEVTIKYRNPDLLKLSLNKTLPTFIADAVIESYKESIGGGDLEKFQEEKLKNGIDANDEVVQDLSKKGYELLSTLCVSHAILNVPESDLAAQPVPLVAWKDIPEEDSIAFLLALIQRSHVAKTDNGGEVTLNDVTEFPEGKRKSKRVSVGTDG